MGNAGFLEYVAARDESVSRIKRHRVDLRIEDHARIAAGARFVDQPRKQRAADAAPAPWRKHRDAADVAVGQKTRAADRRAARIDRERVQRRRVGAVPFERRRDALLDDEHRMANAAQLRRGFGPAKRPDSEIGGRAHR
jgi:hypothetical protein